MQYNVEIEPNFLHKAGKRESERERERERESGREGESKRGREGELEKKSLNEKTID